MFLSLLDSGMVNDCLYLYMISLTLVISKPDSFKGMAMQCSGSKQEKK